MRAACVHRCHAHSDQTARVLLPLLLPLLLPPPLLLPLLLLLLLPLLLLLLLLLPLLGALAAPCRAGIAAVAPGRSSRKGDAIGLLVNILQALDLSLIHI